MTGYKKVIFLAAVILLSVTANVYTNTDHQHHIIESYEFEITGKTKESAVRRLIVPQEEELFHCIDELESSLDGKRQTLFNTRFFHEIEYTYENTRVDGYTSYYHVHFYIDDSFTVLPLPYAKFDSNYGLRAGIKLYERNLFGLFTDLSFVGHASQVDNSFDSIDYFSELRISRIPFGESSMDFFLKLEFTHQDRKTLEDGSFDVRLRLEDLQIFNNTFGFQTRLRMSQIEDEGILSWGDGKLQLSADIGRVQLFSHPYRFNYSMTLLQTNHTWGKPDLESFARLSWLDLTFMDHPYEVVFTSEINFSFIGLDTLLNRTSLGLESSFILPFSIRHQAYLGVSFEMKDYLFNIPSNYMLRTNHTFTKGSINWNNNFREGITGLLAVEGDISLGNDYPALRDMFSFTLRGELTSFILLWNRINISTRTMGFFAHRPQSLLDALDPDEDDTLFPVFLPGNSMNALDQLRGILRVKRNSYGEDERKLGLTSNLNITVLAVKLDEIAEGFVTPFFDFGVFHNQPFSNSISMDKLDFFYTAGLEIHVLFDRLRSYPFRASIGFNLEEVAEHLRGERKFLNIENEIVITMELLF